MHACMQADKQTDTHTYIHTDRQTYIHTYLHTCISNCFCSESTGKIAHASIIRPCHHLAKSFKCVILEEDSLPSLID